MPPVIILFVKSFYSYYKKAMEKEKESDGE